MTVSEFTVKTKKDLDRFCDHWLSKLAECDPNYPQTMDQSDWEEQLIAFMSDREEQLIAFMEIHAGSTEPEGRR